MRTISTEEPKAIIDCALAAASADDLVVFLSRRCSATTRFSDNAITQNVSSEGARITVTAAFGQRHGTAAGNELGEEAVRELVRRAEDIARAAEPDPEYMPPVEPPQDYPEVPAWFEPTTAFGPQRRAAAVREVIGVAREGGLRAAGSITVSWREGWLGNSCGLLAGHRATQARLVVTMIAEDSSGWAERTVNDVTELDVAAVAREARRYAEQARNPVELSPGRYTVVLTPAALDDIISPMVWALDAKAADEGRSVFRGAEGTQVAGEEITLRGDPSCAECPGEPLGEGGLPAGPATVIERGTLKTLVYSRFWAKKKGRPPGPFLTNVIIDGGEATLEELVSSVERGLLVNHCWYVRHVDPMRLLLTGMTRDALLRIENGEIVGGAKHMRWNVSPLDVLKNVRALGRVGRAGQALLPAVVVDDFYLSSGTLF